MNRMERRVIEVVRNVVNEYASTTIPTFDEICSGLGFKVIEDDLPIGTEGMYVEKTIFLIPKYEMRSVNGLPNSMKSHTIYWRKTRI